MRSRRTTVLGVCLVLALAFGGLPLVTQAQSFQAMDRQSLDRIVAVVNESAIMQSDLAERIAQARSQLAARGIEEPPEAVLREQILDQMIVEDIQLQMARDAGLSIDETELNGQVRAIAEGNGMTLEQFADALEADGLTLSVVREEVRREMLLREIQQRRVASRVNVSDREVEQLMEQQGANREQARQAVFQRKANEELEIWLQEIRSQAFVDNRLR